LSSPPRYVRARLYLYRFTTWRQRRESGDWWARTLAGELVPPVRLGPQTTVSRSGELELQAPAR
jgi:hypothetical protein